MQKRGDIYWALLQEGVAIAEIAKEYGVQPRSVRLAIIRAGHTFPTPEPQRPVTFFGFALTERLVGALEELGREKLWEGIALLRERPDLRKGLFPPEGDVQKIFHMQMRSEQRDRLVLLADQWEFRSVSSLVRDAIEALISWHRMTAYQPPGKGRDYPDLSGWSLPEVGVRISVRLPLLLWRQIAHLKQPLGGKPQELNVSAFIREALDACYWSDLERFHFPSPFRPRDRVILREDFVVMVLERHRDNIDHAIAQLPGGWGQQDVLVAVVNQALSLNLVPGFSPNPDWSAPSPEAVQLWKRYCEARSLRAIAAQARLTPILAADILQRAGYLAISEIEREKLFKEAQSQANDA